ncbi:tetratricopeptide repeat protein [Bergeyella cardium]|nr:tetratricopeptide repeat protein [Bergeyella cardium]WHE33234.1 tetratricopeptide repeat protein [Bergeyella cardium]WHF59884.1 tetratricopeptide repeat protein [Bergeyella cardium]
MMRKIYSLLVFFVFFATAQERYKTSIFEGNRAFEKENYDEASAKFMQAVKQKEKDFSAHYNLGNALYKGKKYDEAMAEYKKAEANAKTKQDKMAAHYNLGNAYMQSGNPAKAAEYYKKALKNDPYNEKVRKNYEIAKLKDKENQQSQQNQNQQDKNQQQKDQNNTPKDENNGKPPKGKDQNQQGNDGNTDQKQNKGKNDGERMPKDLEDALLERVKSREQETARKILNKNTYSVPQSNEKDW